MGAVIEQCTQSGEPERFFLRTAKKAECQDRRNLFPGAPE